MTPFVITWGLICLLIVSTEAIREFLIFKANRDEKKRRKRKEAFDFEENSKS